MAGLYIEYKNDHHFLRWISAFLFVVMVFAAAWYAYLWYTQGVKPPIVPLPASAMADPSVDETPVSPETLEAHKVAKTHPRYISIPALNIDKARVQPVGLTKNRLLDTPKNISDTGWFTESATPGQGYGSVIIDGHNGGVSRDGVFAKLSTLMEGDQIIVTRGDGKKITYMVSENKTEPIKDANTTGMKRLMTPFDTTKEGLGLITGAGNWVPRDKVYDKRVLIRAVAE